MTARKPPIGLNHRKIKTKSFFLLFTKGLIASPRKSDCMEKLSVYIFTLFLTTTSLAQPTDKIGQLISAENYFAATAKEKGTKQAFLFVSDEKTIVYRPGPVLAQEFYKKTKEDRGLLSWEPVFAKISKSGDWGFTTGPYTYKSNDISNNIAYGQYLSVWKKNDKDIWKLVLDLGIPHKKPLLSPKLVFNNPLNERFMHQYSDIRLKQREELVLSTDQLYSTVLNADFNIASDEFIAENSRLLFPGNEPIIGKNSIKLFWEKQNVRFNSKPLRANRSFSGELAYTSGDATIEQNGVKKLYHYVRIWEVQNEFKWNILIEVYTEVE